MKRFTMTVCIRVSHAGSLGWRARVRWRYLVEGRAVTATQSRAKTQNYTKRTLKNKTVQNYTEGENRTVTAVLT